MAATDQTPTAETDSQTTTEESLRETLTVEEFRDKLAFEADVQGLPTTHALIIRDTPELLIYANRSRNADGVWEVRGFRVLADRVSFAQTTPERADIAAIIAEVFDPDDLTIDDEYSQQEPIKQGVPTVVAVDGESAIAAWLFRWGASPEQIAHEMGVSKPTVDDYLTQFRRRGTGIPDEMDVPEYGDPMPEIPERFDPSPNGQMTIEELGELS
ncbi:hypothetical protein ACFQDD_01980 [Halorubrum pallidum]|uniref:Helix-turn-helix domain-containing protein n=1 Tax=Halorubrum pallidum TaxID=1526114 RepID=A0ABD5SZG8_9EURY